MIFTIFSRGKSGGAVRISVGLVSNFRDIQAVIEFSRGLLQ
jgi:hypothetical protein